MSIEYNRIAVVGAGAWGTALAQVAAKAGCSVTLWAREPEVIASINGSHENRTFLPGIALEAGIQATADLKEAAAADAILMVTPAQHMRRVLEDLSPAVARGKPVVLCAKGIEQATNHLLTEVLSEAMPQAAPAVLSGPSFAAEVARGLPTAVTLACEDEAIAEALAHAIGLPTFRPYYSSDLTGAEIGGAVKNVLAIACGIVEGKKFGDSARAALTTRGFAELTRLGLAMGARAETLAGLSGLGDLILTCNSPKSRNMSLGIALGEGKTLEEIMGSRNSVSEGVHSATAVVALARHHGIEMPIAEAVAEIVTGAATVDNVIAALLARPFRSET
ncbi:NAD(P)H-dependent glycerol-3-phosphate dehydrogenase [Parvibaculum sp.]|uniref:NAD(P)H-dependent glycerol-3-phosphate dehydrogenase n=1 Tax=Parvibaculum sp. TaxID=2024848 RepID=UPI001B147325|nr:NAD(P)H-dependent glycerol-3-phosphate dehydrogenase [Parvibaculum sp.]MBO6633030.1 NAD(P)-dependent glycerol-3-phosphate dehydrogenase [Parvibaculum sp.]MBO6677370.1 NAD(P)-dependent glycerol-3-phosphate dehydrogenase [Parvibaculum sp.]MBO6684563.1 NAD(P)-dependent glycerol-3-phosphate dehydrogenase [Parvibaculum sp.]MBO6903989.1 NAD(P)-dependent glycerol-3-phosphate dehydrogenase [Parvibaculum sp.]